MTITEKKVVSFHYTLHNAKGEKLESSRGQKPMSYLHGRSAIIKGLEKALEGKTAGDSFEVTVEPSEAYGERKATNIQRVSAKHFRNPKGLKPGQIIGLQTRQGPDVCRRNHRGARRNGRGTGARPRARTGRRRALIWPSYYLSINGHPCPSWIRCANTWFCCAHIFNGLRHRKWRHIHVPR
jgi:hypothetical protein